MTTRLVSGHFIVDTYWWCDTCLPKSPMSTASLYCLHTSCALAFTQELLIVMGRCGSLKYRWPRSQGNSSARSSSHSAVNVLGANSVQSETMSLMVSSGLLHVLHLLSACCFEMFLVLCHRNQAYRRSFEPGAAKPCHICTFVN